MKFFFIITTTVTFCMAIVISNHANPIMGDWTRQVRSDMRTDFAQVRYFAERYQNVKGGLSVVFPKNYFTKIPLVYITIGLLRNPFSSVETAHAIVEECSISGVKIRVNKEHRGIFFDDIVEAEDGEFLVNVFACGD